MQLIQPQAQKGWLPEHPMQEVLATGTYLLVHLEVDYYPYWNLMLTEDLQTGCHLLELYGI
jgi:hypothetical protein